MIQQAGNPYHDTGGHFTDSTLRDSGAPRGNAVAPTAPFAQVAAHALSTGAQVQANPAPKALADHTQAISHLQTVAGTTGPVALATHQVHAAAKRLKAAKGTTKARAKTAHAKALKHLAAHVAKVKKPKSIKAHLAKAKANKVAHLKKIAKLHMHIHKTPTVKYPPFRHAKVPTIKVGHIHSKRGRRYRQPKRH